ncbi:MAG: hypothetical protein AVDCRST_MAG85-1444, partial [uncultured Solirubrobacteraceae bacterium]
APRRQRPPARRGRRRVPPVRGRRLRRPEGQGVQGRARQRLRAHRGRRLQDRRRPRRADQRARPRLEDQAGDRQLQDRGVRLRLDPQRRHLQRRPAVARRRVLRRLRARQEGQGARRGRHDPGRADDLDRPARPGEQHHAPAVPRAPELHHRRARRGGRRQRRQPQRRHPARGAGAARDEQGPGDPRRPEPGARRPRQERRRGHRRARRQEAGREPLGDVDQGDLADLGRAFPRHRRRLRAPADVPARAAPDDGRARVHRRGAGSRPAQPRPHLRPGRAAVREPPAVRRGGRPRVPVAGQGLEGGQRGDRPRACHRRRAVEVQRAGARGRQEPGDHPQAPRRPRLLRRGGPAEPRRQGLHRPRGAAHVLLRPDARDQRPRRQHAHPQRVPARGRLRPVRRHQVGQGAREGVLAGARPEQGRHQLQGRLRPARLRRCRPRPEPRRRQGSDAAHPPRGPAGRRGHPPRRPRRRRPRAQGRRRARARRRRRRLEARRRRAEAAGRAAEARRHPARRRRPEARGPASTPGARGHPAVGPRRHQAPADPVPERSPPERRGAPELPPGRM